VKKLKNAWAVNKQQVTSRSNGGVGSKKRLKGIADRRLRHEPANYYGKTDSVIDFILQRGLTKKGL